MENFGDAASSSFSASQSSGGAANENYQPLPRTPKGGEEAFRAFTNLCFAPGEIIWIKFGHATFFKGVVQKDGNIKISKTQGGEENRRITQEHYIDGYGHLSHLANQKDGGVFYIPGKPSELPLKKYATASNDIGAEMDDGTEEEQWERIGLLSQFGLTPTFVVGSGGKSAHPHLMLAETVPISKWQFFSRMMSIVLIGDPAVTNPHQPMRVPGFFRKEKGREQTLEFKSGKKYTPAELELGLKQCFEKFGFTWREQEDFSETRWAEVRGILASKTLSRPEKEAKLRETLALPELELPANKRKRESEERRQRQQREQVNASNSYDLLNLVEQANQKLGADAFDSPKHNFKWSGGKARGGCPWHESSTGNAGWVAPHSKKPGQYGYACPTCTDNHQVDAFTYWFYQKYGLNTPFPTGKQWVEDAKEFCAFAGINVPDNNFEVGEPDARLYAEYVAKQEEWEQTEKLIAEEKSKQGILNTLSKLRTKIRDFHKLFDKESKTKTAPKIPTLTYSPGNLPTFDDYKKSGNPKIVFKAEHRHQIWAEAIDKGYKNVLDNSHTGAGKSHAIGEFKYEQCNKQFYLAADHRNPTTKTIQDNYVDLVVRHNGLKYDKTRKTPDGRDFQVWPKGGEKPDIYGNCPRQPIFSALASKNIDEEGKHGAVCRTCPWAFMCGESGYKSQRREVLGKKYIRSHPDSLPKVNDAKAYEENTLDYSNSIMFWDEAERLLKISQTITVNLPDLDQIMGLIENADTELFNALQPIRKALRSLFNGDIERKRYGYDDKAIRALLPSKEEFIEHITKFGFDGGSLIEKLFEILKPDLSFLEEKENQLTRDDSKNNNEPEVNNEETEAETTPEQITLELGSEFYSTKQPTNNTKKRTKENKEQKENNRARTQTEKFIDQELRRETRKEMHEAAKDLPLNWLPTFLLIMYYGQSGAFTFSRDKLTIHSKDSTHLDLAREAKANIFVDATLSRNLLALKLEIESSDILLIEEEKPNYSNLTIIQIAGMGKLGRQRADSMKDERIPALKSYLKAHHKDDIAFFDHKVYAEAKDGYHFRDNRGVNRFEGKSALASIGIPYSNIGALKAEFQLLYGYCPDEEGDEKFNAFVDEKVNGEIIQNCGRLRANRSDDQKTYYSIAEYDINFLSEAFPGATIKSQHITDFCIDAASSGDRTVSVVLSAIKDVMSSGQKLTQQVVASIAGVTQGTVSKIISKLGGWKKLKKLFHLLLESFNSTRNNFQNLDENAKWIAQQWFPELIDPPFDVPDPLNVVSEVVNAAKAHGTKKFVDILTHTDFETRVGILACFIRILPDYMQQEFLDINQDLIFEPIEGF